MLEEASTKVARRDLMRQEKDQKDKKFQENEILNVKDRHIYDVH
jgi:hypothetical protein